MLHLEIGGWEVVNIEFHYPSDFCLGEKLGSVSTSLYSLLRTVAPQTILSSLVWCLVADDLPESWPEGYMVVILRQRIRLFRMEDLGEVYATVRTRIKIQIYLQVCMISFLNWQSTK